jgi:flagellar hook-associated protein 1 FlgK
MAGLLSDLTQSAQALDAQQLGLQISGNNLANVNNSSYAVESVQLGSTGVMESNIGEISMGVAATGVTEARDPFLDAQVAQENSQTGSLQAQVTQLTQAQSYLGEQVSASSSTSSISDTSESTTGISSALNNFFDSFSNLASNPTDTGAQQTVLQNAGTLADTINTAYSQLQSLQGDISTQITQGVSTANGLLQNIATLNGQIQQYNVQNPNSTPNDLIDERQADVEQLAGYMNITTSTIPNSGDQIQVTALDANSNPVTLVSKTSVQGNGIAFTGTGFTGGVPTTTLGLTSGSLEGNLTASTGAVQTLINNLSTTASQLTTAVNGAYNPTGATGNFFASTPTSGQLLSLDPSLNANTLKTTNTGNAGANELALAVAQVQNQTFSTANGDQINGTIGGFYSSAVTNIGEAIDGVQSQLTDQTAVQNMVNQQRSSVSGVNEDDELTNLMTYQSAFQAQARVLDTVDSLLDTIVTGLTATSAD